jgi:hypothetical protein
MCEAEEGTATPGRRAAHLPAHPPLGFSVVTSGNRVAREAPTQCRSCDATCALPP